MKAVLQGLSSFLYTQSNIPTVCDFSGGHFDKGRKNKPAMNVVICQRRPNDSLIYQTPQFDSTKNHKDTLT